MSIVPMASLSPSDRLLLGNNLRRSRRKPRRTLAAVNRSLAVHEEQVLRLHRRDYVTTDCVSSTDRPN